MSYGPWPEIKFLLLLFIINASDCASGDCETAGRGRLAAHHGGHPTAPPVDTV